MRVTLNINKQFQDERGKSPITCQNGKRPMITKQMKDNVKYPHADEMVVHLSKEFLILLLFTRTIMSFTNLLIDPSTLVIGVTDTL